MKNLFKHYVLVVSILSFFLLVGCFNNSKLRKIESLINTTLLESYALDIETSTKVTLDNETFLSVNEKMKMINKEEQVLALETVMNDIETLIYFWEDHLYLQVMGDYGVEERDFESIHESIMSVFEVGNMFTGNINVDLEENDDITKYIIVLDEIEFHFDLILELRKMGIEASDIVENFYITVIFDSTRNMVTDIIYQFQLNALVADEEVNFGVEMKIKINAIDDDVVIDVPVYIQNRINAYKNNDI